MIVAYFDSSALVKAVLLEPGSAHARRLWDDASLSASSRLATVEVPAAMAAARRSGRLSHAGLRRATELWAERRRDLAHVELDPGVASLGADLAMEHRLSGADAVHLASALRLGPEVIFACWDERLRAAAMAEGLILAPADTRDT